MKQLLKAERDFLLKENSKYRKQIELNNKRIEDLISLCQWTARRLKTPDANYVKEQLERNKGMEVTE